MDSDRKLAFWNERAGLGTTAGSNDFVIKEIETRALLERIPEQSHIADLGCGNGETLIRLAQERGCTGVGVDFATDMVELARTNAAKAGLGDRLRFLPGRLPDLPDDLGQCDCILTQRCLINLDGAEQQHAAFIRIMDHVTPGGFYFMVESFLQGLAATNGLRQLFALPPIEVPWHNRFLDETIIEGWADARARLGDRIPITSTYHFLSRVVYAAVATQRGEEMRYDSDINMLALKLPIIGDFGPVRLWIWQRQG